MAIISLPEALGEWFPILSPFFQTKDADRLAGIIDRNLPVITPKPDKIFRAFTMTAPDKVKVVILGQDPYHGGQADGLAFSSGDGTLPESLKQIFKSMQESGMVRSTRKLDDWAEQGVLLLNTRLTTIRGTANAHASVGWEAFLLLVLSKLLAAAPARPFYIIGWGTAAHKIIDHMKFPETIGVSKGVHPASVRHGYIFRGGEHMLKANEFLIAHNITPIRWSDRLSS